MRSMIINQKPLYYATLLDVVDNVDEEGNLISGQTPIYSNPVRVKGVISTAKGEAEREIVGINEEYDKSILLENINTPISETSVLWVDRKPVIEIDGSTKTPYDYIVVRPVPSLNHLLIAVKKVTVG